MTDEPDLLAQFDPKLKVYLVLQVAFVLGFTLVGLLALPVWAILGPVWASMYFPTIEARLTQRGLVYCHGVWFRQEMNIPLDKIQDVSLHHGPILDAFGLSTLRVDTAGGGQAGSNATLVGVRDAERFRAAIIARRDAIALGHAPHPEDNVLHEIRNTLLRIEEHLSRRS